MTKIKYKRIYGSVSVSGSNSLRSLLSGDRGLIGSLYKNMFISKSGYYPKLWSKSMSWSWSKSGK